MSDGLPPRGAPDARAEREPATDAAEALRALLQRAVWHAVEAAPRLVPSSRHALSAAHVRPVRGDGAIAAAACEPIRAACAVARERVIPVERLLVLLKEAWVRVPQAERAAREHGDEILACIVTLCIDEFYARDGARHGARRAERGEDSGTPPMSDA